jgi:YfiH family protein
MDAVHASSLTALPGISHAFFTRHGGVSQGIYASLNGGQGSGDLPEHVAENRTRMAATLGVAPDHFVTAYQVHSPDVIVVDRPWSREQRPRGDGMVTRIPGIALGISTADCGPVLFADAEARIVGAAHAGWKGALAGIAEATVGVMERLGAQRRRITAALGPMIQQANYEVGPEFVANFCRDDTENARFFAPSSRRDHAMFDLAGYISARLKRAGIERLEDLGLCTYADARFFSYRRSVHRGDPDYGRHINAIALIE